VTAPVHHPDDVAARRPDDRIRCLPCRAVVTTPDLAVARAGAHEHTFRNPAGYSWTIRCFRDASGCTPSGPLTAEATWFAGYAWRYAHCAACGAHLGWWYAGAGPSFVGLIARRIA